MYQCKIIKTDTCRKKTIFVVPKCGHEIEFEFTTPYLCKHGTCTEKVPQINKLYGDVNQDNRVKFYAEGKL